MSIEIPLKYKYRCLKSKSKYGGSSTGSNKPYRVKGILPVGIPKHYKGKTHHV